MLAAAERRSLMVLNKADLAGLGAAARWRAPIAAPPTAGR